jgi:isopenicillin N synthase-like dioxygenase
MNQDTTCSLIVNTGALMARWTNDVWRATAHRVIIPLDNVQARLSHRYSIAMFFDPDSSTICSVHPKLVAEGDSVKYEPIGSLEYLMMKISEAQMKK